MNLIKPLILAAGFAGLVGSQTEPVDPADSIVALGWKCTGNHVSAVRVAILPSDRKEPEVYLLIIPEGLCGVGT